MSSPLSGSSQQPIQQHQVVRVHIQTCLRCAALVNPRARTQPFRRHLHQRAFLYILRCDIGELVPAVHTQPQGLFLAATVLAIDCHTEAGNLLFTDGLHLWITAYEPCYLNIDARTHDVHSFALTVSTSNGSPYCLIHPCRLLLLMPNSRAVWLTWPLAFALAHCLALWVSLYLLLRPICSSSY